MCWKKPGRQRPDDPAASTCSETRLLEFTFEAVEVNRLPAQSIVGASWSPVFVDEVPETNRVFRQAGFHRGAVVTVLVTLDDQLARREIQTLLRATDKDGATDELPPVMLGPAIPFQGGINHINEQWPTYWRDIFKTFGYLGVDCIRGHIWDRDDVEFWYAQNMVLYVQEEALTSYPSLKKDLETCSARPFSLVHPKLYAINREYNIIENAYFLQALFALPALARKALRNRFNK